MLRLNRFRHRVATGAGREEHRFRCDWQARRPVPGGRHAGGRSRRRGPSVGVGEALALPQEILSREQVASV